MSATADGHLSVRLEVVGLNAGAVVYHVKELGQFLVRDGEIVGLSGKARILVAELFRVVGLKAV